MRNMITLAALFAWMPLALGALNVKAEQVSYMIKGDSAAELRQQMRTKGPRNFFAYASWDIRFNYGYLRQNEACRLSDIKVDLKVVYTMPEFENYKDANNQLKQRWDNFLKNLRIHEEGHGRNGLGAAQEIDAMLQSLPPMANCNLLGQTANQKAQAIIRRYNALDIQYDAQTQHGIKQGAVL